MWKNDIISTENIYIKEYFLVIEYVDVNTHIINKIAEASNSVHANSQFLHSLKTSEKPMVFWYLQGVQKWDIDVKWVKKLLGTQTLNITKLVALRFGLSTKHGEIFNLINNQIRSYHNNIPGYFLSTFHCAKSVHIRSYSGPHFPAFGLNTERYGVSLCI